ncbi:MAG: hypothetical protein CL917_03395 [Deltaproteobacteria bacterium]|nr:hypothetical protein [Deltaproteobacteria bacterium]
MSVSLKSVSQNEITLVLAFGRKGWVGGVELTGGFLDGGPGWTMKSVQERERKRAGQGDGWMESIYTGFFTGLGSRSQTGLF